MDEALGTANYVVAIGEKTRIVGGRVRGDFEDVPDGLGGGEWGPLEGEGEGGRWAGDGEIDLANALALVSVLADVILPSSLNTAHLRIP